MLCINPTIIRRCSRCLVRRCPLPRLQTATRSTNARLPVLLLHGSPTAAPVVRQQSVPKPHSCLPTCPAICNGDSPQPANNTRKCACKAQAKAQPAISSAVCASTCPDVIGVPAPSYHALRACPRNLTPHHDTPLHTLQPGTPALILFHRLNLSRAMVYAVQSARLPPVQCVGQRKP